jgi:hypothetical protein
MPSSLLVPYVVLKTRRARQGLQHSLSMGVTIAEWLFRPETRYALRSLASRCQFGESLPPQKQVSNRNGVYQRQQAKSCC